MKNLSDVRYQILSFVVIVSGLFLFTSCESALDQETFSELSAEGFLKTKNGVRSALNGTYENFHNRRDMQYRKLIDVFEAGYGYNESGSFEARYASIHEKFLWNSNDNMAEDNWEYGYEIIREANIVLDALENNEFNEDFVQEVRPQALAMRGFAYNFLYKFFGTVPIFTSSNPETTTKPRASEEDLLNRIETDLTNAISNLPIQQEEFGRVTKGAALTMLAKHYLNTKKWQKAIDVTDQVINLGEYRLLDNYQEIFSYSNEKNDEIIYAFPSDVANAPSWPLMCITIPTDFPLKSNQSTCAARLYAYDWFINSFAEDDTRDDDLVRSYTNKDGKEVNGFGENKTLMMFKYGPDPNANGVTAGLDLIMFRYADILLSKAEALNEINGPNSESIRLINMIRERAGVEPVSQGDFASKQDLRDFIFEERRKELYYEGKSREDLIRWEKYISRAQERGIDAQPFHRLYPIPQSELDANPEIEQNPGY